ncbi:PleD family two-component system response regulator [Stappia sp. F7233]|uniref:diguanylate cyclase n=1 Tax=Stappia albiluteola TaxID=2758565 RepID=A0A839AGE5_9HYPH|nr:PleD family two-component system response regulator [Stappia albiluteola]MBA5778004.1 PleD family two-component system response regulator [Stappia albiluteola]
MTGRILVVDDVRANVRLLEARLLAEYFEVKTASRGEDALSAVASWPCDVVLLDVMMPGMDGFETCRRLKADPRSAHIPVVMITALDQLEDRIKGFEAGADDFLTKPINDMALVTRVRNLIALKRATDELRMRAQTGSAFGADDADDCARGAPCAKLLLVDDRASSSERITAMLGDDHNVDVESDAQQAFFRVADQSYDGVLVSLSLNDFDPLRLCSQLRDLERTRQVPIMVLAEPDDQPRVLRALELGVNDYLLRPVDRTELKLRVRSQVARKRANDRLINDVQKTIALAVTDALTGLYNRRYLETHLRTLLRQARERDAELSVLTLDIDYFKTVNDTHGHDAGDDVLREFARRIRANIRGLDLACRFGGEEFVIVMPDTDLSIANKVAERIRRLTASAPFLIGRDGAKLDVTVSVGVSSYQGETDTLDELLKRSDRALYAAKREGRNRVVSLAA